MWDGGGGGNHGVMRKGSLAQDRVVRGVTGHLGAIGGCLRGLEAWRKLQEKKREELEGLGKTEGAISNRRKEKRNEEG